MVKLKSNYKELKSYNETGTLRTMSILFSFPEKEFTLSDLASESKVAKQNIKKIVHTLHTQKLVEIARWGKRIWRIKAHQRDWKFIRAKIIYNLHMIYESNLIELLEEIFDRPRVIILFGSFRYGEDVSTSDIDIAIESHLVNEYTIVRTKELQEMKFVTKESYKRLEDIEKILGKKVQLHLFNRKDFHKKEFSSNVLNSILNGIVLYGYMEFPHETRKN